MGSIWWTGRWRGFDALALSVSLKVRRAGSIAGYGIASTLFLCGLTGLLSVCYAFLYTLLALLRYKTSRQRLAAAACLIPALFIYLFSGWLGIPVPLSDGLDAGSYLEITAITSLLYVSLYGLLYPFDCRCCFICSLCSGDWREE